VFLQQQASSPPSYNSLAYFRRRLTRTRHSIVLPTLVIISSHSSKMLNLSD